MLESDQLHATLDHVLRGQSDAFLVIVRAYGPGLRTYLGSQLFHLDDADDLAQETFIAAYRNLNTFRRGEDFGAWLRGIARNKLLRFFEQTNRRVVNLETFRREASNLLQGELEGAAAETKSEQLQAMLSCITKLPDRIRHVVRSLLDGSKAPALAEELKTTTGAVYQLQYRALGMLRECITRELADEH
ncbi:sigma-70 family RNA polymerase sigma factor [Brevifollis gellanilyticus]|uniref:RNA polymerase sigma factor n=1 Tax=Brevifollis gellanilyticus TaxID=748831 RepID=A0A512M8E4_9BACT|nr:sigma-70 family RNA polymerase sigma factor [Brevifollis gellanilyticus]GEP43010.1 RNA polymerase sigma factor [Brevifollis gellanilyticus]